MIAYMDGLVLRRSWMNLGLGQAARGGGRLVGLCAGLATAILAWPGQAWPDEIQTDPTNSPAITSITPGTERASPESPMHVTVQRMEATQQQIVLTSGRSAVIDLSEPLARAQVADPSVVEVAVLSPRQVLVSSKAVGFTQIILWDQNDRQVIMPVVVELDLVELVSAIRNAAPGSAVEVRAVKDTVVLTGAVPDVDTASRITDLAKVFSPKVQNQLKVGGVHQVLLRCTVAEVNKRATRQLGINGWIAGDNVRDMFAVNQLDQINPVNIGAGPTGNIIQNGGLLFATDKDGLPLTATPTLSVGFPRLQMQLFFQALRENTLLRVLAEPNLVALSGQEAWFQAGGSYPYPLPQGIGTTPSVDFQEYGIILKFTPTVIGNQMIRLHVQPTVSEPDYTTAVTFAGTTVPGLRVRTAETTIELAGGTTIAIAGLLSEEARASSKKVPGLGDVPVLGALFSSVNYQKNLTELVILVTPELVSSLQPDQVAAVPGQFMRDPNDWELFGLGMVEGKPMDEEPNDDAALETQTPPKFRKFRSPPHQMSLHGPWGPAEEAETIQ